MEYLRSNDQSERTFYCDVVYDGKPRKDKSDKWYVSDDEYEKVYNLTSYPTFCLGPAYIMTADLIQKLYEQSFDVRLFWLEDIYTSLLASRVSNVTFVQFNEKYATKAEISYRKDYVVVRNIETEQDLNYVMKYLLS